MLGGRTEMKPAHTATARITIVAVLGVFLGIGLHGVVLSCFDGVRLLRKGGEQAVTWATPTDVQPTVSSSLAATLCASPAGGHGQLSASAHPWLYADAENYYVVDRFPAMTIPCSYYARLLGCRISREHGKVFNRHTQRWEPRGFVNMPVADAERLLSKNMTLDVVLTVLGYPLSTLGEGGGLRNKSDGKPCVAYRYLCQDGPLFVVLTQSVVVGIQTNDIATAL